MEMGEERLFFVRKKSSRKTGRGAGGTSREKADRSVAAKSKDGRKPTVRKKKKKKT